MKILFPDFLNNKDAYVASVNLWKTICAEIIEQQAQSDNWNYGEYEMTPDNANFDMGGNPIYWLVNSEQKRGVSIIQLDPQIKTKWTISALMSSASDEFLLHGKRTELVYSCQLTEEAILKFKLLFEAWTKPECTLLKLDELIKNLIGE